MSMKLYDEMSIESIFLKQCCENCNPSCMFGAARTKRLSAVLSVVLVAMVY